MKKFWGAALCVMAGTALSACAVPESFRQSILAPQGATSTTQQAQTQEAPVVHPLMHPLFQEHAVIQRDKPITVWGWTQPFADVRVSLGSGSASGAADGAGRWEATLPAMAAGGPYRLTATSSGGASQTVDDVLVGDVWLCSGQSNMEMEMRKVSNADTEIGNSANARIRLLTVPRASETAPRDSLPAGARWQVSGPDSVRDFSAACYFMGRDLQSALSVPIGLIASSWGGTRIQAWISEFGLRGIGNYGEALAMLDFYEASPEAAQLSWNNTLTRWWRTNDPGSAAPIPWSAPEFNDSAWTSTTTPGGIWENSGIAALSNFDGTVWYRTTVNLTIAQARQAATLSLGPIDDMDSTWINGIRVGGEQGWDTPRSYAVPAGLLRPGQNLIAIGVLDTGGGGGLSAPASAKLLTFADGSSAPLNGAWKVRISGTLSETGAAPPAPWISANGLATLNNGMIAPLAPFGLRGVAWYQGEANVAEPDEYKRLLPALMADWRRQFGVNNLPFAIVQLANFGKPATQAGESGWAGVREAQRLAVNNDANAGLVVTIDIGDPYDIHPTNKQEVGRRLALVARDVAYRQAVNAKGPSPTVARHSRRAVMVNFANAGDRLVTWGGARPLGFELCDAARNCQYVDAAISGPRVALDASRIRRPAFVRYCWADSPVCNMTNAAGLPAVPFEISVN